MSLYLFEIDTCPAYGWSCEPSADVLIHELRNKHKRRTWIDGVIPHVFNLPFLNIEHLAYLEDLKTMFMAMVGPLHTFLAKDHADYRHGFASNGYAPMQFGVGESAVSEYQLSKTYRKVVGAEEASFVRPITKPLLEGLVIYVNGVADPSAVVDPRTGKVDFGTGGVSDGDVLTWSGEFRVPVMFHEFSLPASIDSQSEEGYRLNCSCRLIEDFSYDEVDE